MADRRGGARAVWPPALETRFAEHVAWRIRRPFVTVGLFDDLSTSDLVGRYLVRASETVWQAATSLLRARGQEPR